MWQSGVPTGLSLCWGGDGTRDFSTPPSAKCPPPPPHLCQKTLVAFNRARGGAGWTHRDRDRDRAAAAGGGGPGPGPGGCGGGVSRGPAVPGPIGSSPRTPRPVLPMCRNSPAATGSRFPRGGRAGGRRSIPGAERGRSRPEPVPSRMAPRRTEQQPVPAVLGARWIR